MLQKFNKLAMCLISVITITSTYSHEYIVINASQTYKEQIYDVVSKFRFPSILSKFTQQEFRTKYPNHDLIDTFKTSDTEYKFVTGEISKIDKQAEVVAIPKSLYQFITYDYFDRTISAPEKVTGQNCFDKLYEQKDKFDLIQYAQENEEWGLTRACSRFMANEAIKDIFWKVNDHAKNLYMTHKGKMESIIHEMFDVYRSDNHSRKGLLDVWNLLQQKYPTRKIHAGISRIETMVGKTSGGKIPDGWNEEKRQDLKRYTTNCIMSEVANPKYVVYHGGNLYNPKPEMANRRSICFSDGLFSGYIFDAGASAYVYSVNPNTLWRLELDREKLLKEEYPIFIPPAFHLLSAAGNGELFHARTKVVHAVMDDETKCIDEYALSIKFSMKPLVAGFKLNETPEYFTSQNPQILLAKRDEHHNALYESTNKGIFDKDGAQKLKAMINTITAVPDNGVF